ncbi:MAG TPA: VanW family protein [Brevefilum sp.]
MKTETKKNIPLQLILALPLSLLIFLILLFAALVGFEIKYADRIFPGVYVQQQDLSGMTLEEASGYLAAALPYTYQGELRLTYEDKVWEAQPIDLGYLIDPNASAQQAYDVGRGKWLTQDWIDRGKAWFTGVHLSPIAFFDQRAGLSYLQNIAEAIDLPLREASLDLQNSEVVVEPGQVGLTLDIVNTLAAITPKLTNMESGEASLIVESFEPEILDVGPQAELAREMLSESLVLVAPMTAERDETWEIAPDALADMLIINRINDGEGGAAEFQISLNEDLFRIYLDSLKPGLHIDPVNARFIFNDETRVLEVIEPAVIGRDLDVDASIESISETLRSGEHEVALQFEALTPEVTDETPGEALGIIELVEERTTYFYGSDAARIQNIKTASAEFHGLLVAPGATFSMANALGNISLENGYAEALIIYGGQTIQGVGGGVCQVSTTLFRTAFFAGFPIVERHPHAYRVGYYEMEYGGGRDSNWAGFDATVYVPIVDFKFTNDTDHWLLMETYVTGNNALTWKFYSTDDGRSVDWRTTGPTNIVEAPEPLYRENPDLEKGEIKQVDYEADGADININRTVYKDDKVHFADSFFTRFRPWQAIYEYGPGTEGIPEQESD